MAVAEQQSKKPLMEIELTEDSSLPKYVGRYLGCINDAELAKIIEHKELRGKIMTSESATFSDLRRRVNILENDRLVFALINKIQGGIKIHVSKTLLITERLITFKYVYSDEIGMIGESGKIISVKETRSENA